MDKEQLLGKLLDMIAVQHNKMDGVTTSPELKAKSEGYLEALYQVESLVINWESNEVDIKTRGIN
jgi:hypothetical protein